MTDASQDPPPALNTGRRLTVINGGKAGTWPKLEPGEPGERPEWEPYDALVALHDALGRIRSYVDDTDSCAAYWLEVAEQERAARERRRHIRLKPLP